MPVRYIAVETFGPEHEGWGKYINGSKLYHLKEIISLDSCLCPDLLKSDNETEEYYDYESKAYTDLGWLLNKVIDYKNKHILAVLWEPTEEAIETFSDSRFSFCGFDLVDKISLLTNCGGGFDGVFDSHDLNSFGLIQDLKKARRVQELLPQKYPDESHAYCDLYAIWNLADLVFYRLVTL